VRISSDTRLSSALELNASRTKSSMVGDEEVRAEELDEDDDDDDDDEVPEGEEEPGDGDARALAASPEVSPALVTPASATDIGEAERDPPPAEYPDRGEAWLPACEADRADCERRMSRRDGEPVEGAFPMVSRDLAFSRFLPDKSNLT
jgi:hypothetical protein